jgi:gluconokinase
VDPQVRVVFLKGSPALLHERMQTRRGHYMKEGMLDSQFATLEQPKGAITVDVSGSVNDVVREVRRQLGV